MPVTRAKLFMLNFFKLGFNGLILIFIYLSGQKMSLEFLKNKL